MSDGSDSMAEQWVPGWDVVRTTEVQIARWANMMISH